MAMKNHAALDPGNALFRGWFEANSNPKQNLVIDVGGGNGHIAKFLAEVGYSPYSAPRLYWMPALG
jgi:16S rRNA G1207 methylase RsmC